MPWDNLPPAGRTRGGTNTNSSCGRTSPPRPWPACAAWASPPPSCSAPAAGWTRRSWRRAKRPAWPTTWKNIGTDLYATYHRYSPNQSVTWRFDRDRARRQADPSDPSVFLREPGLSDPAAIAGIQARLRTLVQARAADQPLFYNLADESGIADLAAAWDYDQSPTALAGFRVWLRQAYGSLDALNAQWGHRLCRVGHRAAGADRRRHPPDG